MGRVKLNKVFLKKWPDLYEHNLRSSLKHNHDVVILITLDYAGIYRSP